MPRLAKLSISVAELPGSAITTFRVTVEAGSPLPSSWMRWIGLSRVTPSPMRKAAPPVISAVLSATTGSSSRGLT